MHIKKLIKWLGIVGLILIVLIVIFMAFYLADIRPNSFRNTHISDIAINSGRELLREVESAHGLEQWMRRTTTDMLAVDDWIWYNKTRGCD